MLLCFNFIRGKGQLTIMYCLLGFVGMAGSGPKNMANVANLNLSKIENSLAQMGCFYRLHRL